MSGIKHHSATLVGLVLLAAALILPTQALAQDEEEVFFSVRTFEVEPGQGEEFRGLMSQLVQAMDADGRQPRALYQEVRGQLGTYYNVAGIENFAALDEAFTPPMSEDEWTDWLDDLWDVGRSMSLVIYRAYPELSIEPPDDAGPSDLIILRFTTVYPGKNEAYRSWVETKLKPALEEGGVIGINFSRAVLGANPNMWVSGNRIANWAQLDGDGPLAHLSDEERAELFDGWDDIVKSTDVRVIRFLPDISSPPSD